MTCQHRQQRGVALITAMLIVALAAVIGASMLTQMNLALHRSGYIWHSEQAWWYAVGVENWLGVILDRDARHSDTDNLQEPWAQPIDYLPLDGGALSGRLIDLQGRFNLNNLGQAQPQAALRYFTRLIQRVLDTDPATARTIAVATRDWIDADIHPTGARGAEDNYYLGLDPAYRAGDTPMTSRSELRLVRGVTPAIYTQLAPYVTALPQPTPINVNTAPAPVLAALTAELPADAGKQLIAQRDDKPWDSVQAFMREGVLAGRPLNPKQLSVTTHYFLASGRISIGKTHVRFFSKLFRGADGHVHVIAHSTSTH